MIELALCFFCKGGVIVDSDNYCRKLCSVCLYILCVISALESLFTLLCYFAHHIEKLAYLLNIAFIENAAAVRGFLKWRERLT